MSLIHTPSQSTALQVLFHIQPLNNGVIVSELATYKKLLDFTGVEGFARLFVDSGYILTGLMGLEIESGVLLNSQYLEEMGGVRSLIVIM